MQEGVIMVLKGLDVGYSYTKDNSGNIFKTAYSQYDNSLSGSKHINIDGENYYVGEGITTTDYNKSTSTINKVCTLYNLAATNNGNLDYILSVGLPVQQYTEKNREFLKDTIMSYSNCLVQYESRKFKFNIKNVIVNPQGIAAIFTTENELYGQYIVIDVGGGTIDVSLLEFENSSSKIVKRSTYYKGIKTLFDPVIGAINNTYELKLEPSYAEKFLQGYPLTVNGEKADLKFITPILRAYIDDIVTTIKINYPVNTARIMLCGGGSILIYNPILKQFPNAELMRNSQFANAIGYYIIARGR